MFRRGYIDRMYGFAAGMTERLFTLNFTTCIVGRGTIELFGPKSVSFFLSLTIFRWSRSIYSPYIFQHIYSYRL
ncbi:hypothetical protein VTO42DRAFT_2208 [Malbranchea cinnamomea]